MLRILCYFSLCFVVQSLIYVYFGSGTLNTQEHALTTHMYIIKVIFEPTTL